MDYSKRYVFFAAFVAALGGLLFGYDTAVISGGIGFLRIHFGLSAANMGWAASSALLGCVGGVAFAGVLADFFGRKKVLILAANLFAVSAIGSALPQTLEQFVIFRMIGGFGVGTASMLSPLFIAEISPPHLRGRLVSWNQFAIVTGMLVVYFVNYFIANSGEDSWNIAVGWRWMFASEAIPAVLFFSLLFLVPESPRWLIKQGQIQKGRDILTKICGRIKAGKEMQDIQKTLDEERGSLGELFKPGLRTLLFVGMALAILQQVTGINVFLYYAPEIFKKLGSGTNTALLQTVIIGVFNLGFTIVAIKNVDKIGRKPLMLIGASGMFICLTALGLAAYFQQADIWVLIFILGYIASFALSVGPVTWVILSEIFPTRIRGRAMSICTILLWASNYVVSQTFPMMDENPWLLKTFHHAFNFWLYALFCIVLFVVVKTLVPETKGKSLEEIEHFWLAKDNESI